jgi:2-keto-4-pentenoate hydratase/2-oxohepta-3-ene-1,7-dioic acid hydratase in catechol pathway
VLGPWIVTSDELGDASELDLELRVNGEVRQESNTRNLILGIPQLIEMASSMYTLQPGDILLTGTPHGVGPLNPGDNVLASIENIGSMQVPIRAA